MIQTTDMEGARVLTLARGKANALDAEFLRAIASEVRAAETAAPRGLVLTAEGSIFCAGLDLPALVELEREGIEDLLVALREACLALFRFPRPTVAAINGHTVAGGALLTLACDRRHMAQGNGKWGLNEAQLGLSVPAFAVEMMRYALPRAIVEKLLYGGQLYPTFKADDMQIVDELVEAEQLLPSALTAIEEWTPSVEAFADIKARLRAPTLAAMQQAVDSDPEFVDQWFDESVHARLKAAVAKLQEGRKRD